VLEQGGFNVDMQRWMADGGQAPAPRKEPADKGGWSAFHTYAIAAGHPHPIAANSRSANGGQGVVRLAPTIRRWRSCATAMQGKPIRPSQGFGGGGLQARAFETAQMTARQVVRAGRRARQSQGW